jgi:putative ABC transport system substrate-binding protein
MHEEPSNDQTARVDNPAVTPLRGGRADPVMDRRTFISGVAAGLVTAPLAAGAQQAGKVPRVGLLDPTSPSSAAPYHDAFRQGLRERGYVERQNIAIEYRFAEGQVERLPTLAAELVRDKADVIVAAAAPAVHAAQRATTLIPIVMVAFGADPVETGLVASLAHPGGTITGSTLLFPELTAKRLQLLLEAVPKVARVAVLWNSANPAKAQDWREAQVAGRVRGVTLQSVEVQGPEQFERAFGSMTRERADALLVLGDVLTFVHRKRITEFAAKHRLPAVYNERAYAKVGGLISYAADLHEDFHRAATYVDKILKGAKPADLPVEQPTKFELVINLKTAKALGLTIPPSLLVRADEVIQ